jgi:hypothetical protein
MESPRTTLRKFITAATIAASLALAAPANAATVQLGFILDRSGSIGGANWTTIVNGLASAVNTHIPVGGADTYEVSVVAFQSNAVIAISNFLVTDAAARTALAAQIAAIPFTGGGTAFGPAFDAMRLALLASPNVTLGDPGTTSYVNFATDGVQGDIAAGLAARNALIAAGVDNISVEGIGAGVDALDLQNNYCYPGPCDTSAPFNFPAQGFYIGVANADAYAAAIGGKIQVVVNPNPVPEPGTIALLGLGLGLAVGARRLRRRNS